MAATPIPLVAKIEVLPVRGGEGLVHRMFEPLGYNVEAVRHPLDEKFPEWGESPYFSVSISGTKTLSELLTHLYVLVPVFDNDKHYFVGDDELEKLISKGDGWLAQHPEKEQITRRYLKHQSGLYREALARLMEVEEPHQKFCVWLVQPIPEFSAITGPPHCGARHSTSTYCTQHYTDYVETM